LQVIIATTKGVSVMKQGRIRLFAFLFCFVSLASISARAQPRKHFRVHPMIVGGTDMTSQDPLQRSTAAMYSPSSNGPGGALCTASLIGNNMAVTAAHCVQPGGYAPVLIFGPDVRSPDSVHRPVTGEVVNPAWAKKAGHGMDQGDIAVVKFGGGLPPGYKPAALDSSPDQIQKGEAAVLAGYGISNAKTQEGAGVLRKTTVAVSNARHGKSEMILDQTRGHGACHGDSGGPAYLQRGKAMVLAGVTNRSYPNSAADDCAHKIVYTKVAAYRPWIESSEAQLNRQKSSSDLASIQPRIPVRSLSKNVLKKVKTLKNAKVVRMTNGVKLAKLKVPKRKRPAKISRLHRQFQRMTAKKTRLAKKS
jgi:hypothetical protein